VLLLTLIKGDLNQMKKAKYVLSVLLVIGAITIPAQSVKSEPVTLGIIGTALGAAALGLSVINSASKASKSRVNELDCRMQRSCGGGGMAMMPQPQYYTMPAQAPMMQQAPIMQQPAQMAQRPDLGPIPDVPIEAPAPIIKQPITVAIPVIQPVQYYYQPIVVPMPTAVVPAPAYSGSYGYNNYSSYSYRRY
jgi:hypothetical protein